MHREGILAEREIRSDVYFVVVIALRIGGRGAHSDEFSVDIELIVVVRAYPQYRALNALKEELFAKKNMSVKEFFVLFGKVELLLFLVKHILRVLCGKILVTDKLRLHKATPFLNSFQ